MIRNERQYQITARQRKLLADSLDELRSQISENPFSAVSDNEKLGLDLERASLTGQIAKLDNELGEYEDLRSGSSEPVRVTSLTELPDTLVRARIAKGWTQKELAERLRMKTQQIQRYEDEGYIRASLARIQEVIQVLDVHLDADLELPNQPISINSLRRRLIATGLDKSVVDKRILRNSSSRTSTTKIMEYAERAARLLVVPIEHLLESSGPLPPVATTARFKAPRNAADKSIQAYTRYAESVAEIVLRSTRHLGPPIIPTDSRSFRESIDERAHLISSNKQDPLMDSMTLFLATLQRLYESNIPVIPLRDPGAFHGACFAAHGRAVIVLKQSDDSPARWLFDLLHEIDHLRDPHQVEPRTWIELGEISEWSSSPEEQHAHNFAADILFYGRAESVLEMCLERAQGSVERLKSVIPSVADRAGVPVDVLANYLAFHLSERKINWWGTAATFQSSDSPSRTAADLLLRQLDLSTLDLVDRGALIDGVLT